MSHTPEPWKEVEYSDYEIKQAGSIRGFNNQCVVSPRQGVVGRNLEESEANANRIVACVNGCAGLNPAAYRECVEALTAIIARINGEFDNPALLKQGLLGLDSLEGMKRMAEHVLAQAEQKP